MAGSGKITEKTPVETSAKTKSTEAKEAPKASSEEIQIQPETPDVYRETMQSDLNMRVVDHPARFLLRVMGHVLHDRRAEMTERRGEGERSEPRDRSERGERGDRQGRAEGGQGRRGVRHGGAIDAEHADTAQKIQGGDVEMVGENVLIGMAKFGDKEKQLSAFEKTLIGRFEEGEQQATESQDGKFHFLKKTAAEWTGFFEKFLSRGMQKIANWSDVQGFLFRGLLQEKGAPQKGVLISDILMANGTDKFARVPIALGKAQQIVLATPGAVLTKDMVQEAALGNRLQYLALGAAVAEEGAAGFVKSASRGMFMSQQLENRVAEQLGLVSDFRGVGPRGIEAQHAQTEKAEQERRRRGAWSRWWGGDEVDGEGSVFVPWWRWDREERTGFRRWFVAVFGAVIFVALFFLIIVLVRALRP